MCILNKLPMEIKCIKKIKNFNIIIAIKKLLYVSCKEQFSKKKN